MCGELGVGQEEKGKGNGEITKRKKKKQLNKNFKIFNQCLLVKVSGLTIMVIVFLFEYY